ncbi:hypothetical protein H4219_001965 [Mycoemilia scoparia]|uniref:Corrinoid adenosyltransferase MMAB n=1 Tax=Mycoemilia scoparia TaxID=417184 RepID=A0A9W7ZYX0_9FUNG|nr:hypothetical protein H4219_001965 [Mycoemilia scoparia]
MDSKDVIKTPSELTGDKGNSSLYTGERRSKNDPVFEALGATDELSSTIGLAIAHLEGVDKTAELSKQLQFIQCMLQDVGSNIATPISSKSDVKKDQTRFDPDGAAVTELEGWIDELMPKLPSHRHFILPSGGLAASTLHVARTVCRRAERAIIPLLGEVDDSAFAYVNRLAATSKIATAFLARNYATKKLLISSEMHSYSNSMSNLDEPPHLSAVYSKTMDKYRGANKMISPLQGRMISWLVGSLGCKQILELGSFTGYSALWMAEGIYNKHGSKDSQMCHIWTCERVKSIAEIAERNIENGGASDLITVIPKEAIDV